MQTQTKIEYASKEQQRQCDNLQYKIDTTPRYLGKFIYVRALHKLRLEIAKVEAKKHHLNLCLLHQQESTHAHYDQRNCDYCKLFAPKETMQKGITLTKREIQSNLNRQRSAEGLIRQLPESHDGRNGWLLNYGVSVEAINRREKSGLLFNDTLQAAESRNEQLERQRKC